MVAAWRTPPLGLAERQRRHEPGHCRGLLWVYDLGGGLRVYQPASGKLVTTLSAGAGHWNSPIATDGRVALPEGNANDHATSGVLDIWRLKSG